MDEDDQPDLELPDPTLWRRRTIPLTDPKAIEDLPRGCTAKKSHECHPQICLGLIHNSPNDYGPTFYPNRKAEKALSADMVHPVLGKNPFGSQPGLYLRWPPSPQPGEYPAWYFFYDNPLGDPEEFKENMGLEEVPKMYKAMVYGAQLALQGNSVGLVDGPTAAYVTGSAYIVQTEELEDEILSFAGCTFEVVRCEIRLDSLNSARGLTLRRIKEMAFLKDVG